MHCIFDCYLNATLLLSAQVTFQGPFFLLYSVLILLIPSTIAILARDDNHSIKTLFGPVLAFRIRLVLRIKIKGTF